MINSRQRSFSSSLVPILFFILRISMPAMLILSIAIPEHFHFEIERNRPTAELIQQLERQPSSMLLAEVSEMSLAISLGIPVDQHIAAAQNILSGNLEVPEFLSQPVSIGGWPSDLLHGGPTLQLSLASLAIEDLLLEAFEREKNLAFYLSARDRILAFAAWEEEQRDPTPFLWNDHAVAARIPVLIRLWRHMRNDDRSTLDQKAALVGLVSRSGELLAKSNLFTVRTNHGVMQNIALLQIGATFPFLPKIATWRKLALERLDMQLAHYVSDEGVVLEHSAEYQLFGTELLAYAVRLCRLNGIEASGRLRRAYAGTVEFTKLLVRPDGSLPLVGNTAAGNPARIAITSSDGNTRVALREPPFAVPTPGVYRFPLSGYAIWWSSDPVPSQTVIAWAKHKNHGHKHADEASLNFWSRGYSWITGTGYWPYGQAGFDDANGWKGSNSPHEENEHADSERTIHLLGQGEAMENRVVDIEVNRLSGLKTRRQIIQLGNEEILVLDFVDGANTATETLWTVDPRLTLHRVDATHFTTRTNLDGIYFQVALDSNDPTRLNAVLAQGSTSPFAGWVVVGRKPRPATTIRISSQAQRYVNAALFSVTKDLTPISVRLIEAAGEEEWALVVSRAGGSLHIEREGQRILFSGPGANSLGISLAPPPAVTTRLNKLRAAMTESLKQYPPWRDLSIYHKRLYLLVFALWLTTEIFRGLLQRRWRLKSWHEYTIVLSWIGIAAWVHFVYLV